MNISIFGRNELYIENYCSIMEYNECVIKIRGKKENVRIVGNNINVDIYSKSDMCVKGIFKEISFF